MTRDNPYESPQPLADAPVPAVPRERSLLWGWTVVFSLNLIVPLMFAMNIARGQAWIGVGLAIATMLAAGLAACAYSRRLGRILITGGIFTGAAQFFPLLHLFVGLAAFDIAGRLSLGSPAQLPSMPSGFVLTMLVGTELLLIALVVGAGVQRCLPKKKEKA
jgi:hypothetical protein